MYLTGQRLRTWLTSDRLRNREPVDHEQFLDAPLLVETLFVDLARLVTVNPYGAGFLDISDG